MIFIVNFNQESLCIGKSKLRGPFINIPNKRALDSFLNWMVSLTKQDHSTIVFLASSDGFFMKLIETRLKGLANSIVIGDLPKEQALVYFNLVKPNDFPFYFETLYSITW